MGRLPPKNRNSRLVADLTRYRDHEDVLSGVRAILDRSDEAVRELRNARVLKLMMQSADGGTTSAQDTRIPSEKLLAYLLDELSPDEVRILEGQLVGNQSALNILLNLKRDLDGPVSSDGKHMVFSLAQTAERIPLGSLRWNIRRERLYFEFIPSAEALAIPESDILSRPDIESALPSHFSFPSELGSDSITPRKTIPYGSRGAFRVADKRVPRDNLRRGSRENRTLDGIRAEIDGLVSAEQNLLMAIKELQMRNFHSRVADKLDRLGMAMRNIRGLAAQVREEFSRYSDSEPDLQFDALSEAIHPLESSISGELQAKINMGEAILLLRGRAESSGGKLELYLGDGEAGHALRDADLTLVRPSEDFVDAVTDDDGRASFELGADKSILHIHLEKCWELELIKQP
jgi:hypothetical protein